MKRQAFIAFVFFLVAVAAAQASELTPTEFFGVKVGVHKRWERRIQISLFEGERLDKKVQVEKYEETVPEVVEVRGRTVFRVLRSNIKQDGKFAEGVYIEGNRLKEVMAERGLESFWATDAVVAEVPSNEGDTFDHDTFTWTWQREKKPLVTKAGKFSDCWTAKATEPRRENTWNGKWMRAKTNVRTYCSGPGLVRRGIIYKGGGEDMAELTKFTIENVNK